MTTARSRPHSPIRLHHSLRVGPRAIALRPGRRRTTVQRLRRNVARSDRSHSRARGNVLLMSGGRRRDAGGFGWSVVPAHRGQTAMGSVPGPHPQTDCQETDLRPRTSGSRQFDWKDTVAARLGRQQTAVADMRRLGPRQILLGRTCGSRGRAFSRRTGVGDWRWWQTRITG